MREVGPLLGPDTLHFHPLLLFLMHLFFVLEVREPTPGVRQLWVCVPRLIGLLVFASVLL